jgi:hypothetical protein
MKRYILLAFLLIASIWVTITAQDIDIKVEILNSGSNELNSDIIITVLKGQPDFKIYLYDFDKPSWKGGQPRQSVTAVMSMEVKLTDISSGKYYLVAEDAANNVTIKLIDLKTNVQ